jgi:hypothetical protein
VVIQPLPSFFPAFDDKALPWGHWQVDDKTGLGPRLLSTPSTVVADTAFPADNDLEKGNSKSIQLPPKRQSRPVRVFRHTLWNVYRRLFSIVFAANAAVLVAYLVRASSVWEIDIWDLTTAASANIFVATAIRQDYIQGIMYRSAMLVPHSAPLKLRRMVAKTYENGGVHSGCGVAGTVWFLAATVVLSIQHSSSNFRFDPVIALTYVLAGLLVLVVLAAYPSFRAKQHNTFEMTHRLAGWTIIILFWVVLGLLSGSVAKTQHTNVGLVFVKQPSFWFLLLTTLHTILPWLSLRRWDFRAEALSNHAVRLHFKKDIKPYTGIAISRSPLFEWHPFATMPSLADKPTKGGSLICSAAGDWTKDTVASPQKHYWVKGVPKPGVLCLSVIFKRVVIVTTGSGIGPCLSILASPHRRNTCRVLWSGPEPEKVFGSEIVDSVRRVDPRAVIINTRRQGRPDMVALTYQLYIESCAEAVFVISNPKLTRDIVYGMESRGVPAYGPIWDS